MSDMYACGLCGKPTPNFKPWTCGPIAGKLGRSWCDDCEKRFEREHAWENEQWHKDEITCPWCGYVDTDSWEFEGEYDDAYECPSCGKPFILERIIDITYTSKRRVDDMPEGWCGDEPIRDEEDADE